MTIRSVLGGPSFTVAAAFGVGLVALGLLADVAWAQVPAEYDLYPLLEDNGTYVRGPSPIVRDMVEYPYGAGDSGRYVRVSDGQQIPEPGTMLSLAGLVVSVGLFVFLRRLRRK